MDIQDAESEYRATLSEQNLEEYMALERLGLQSYFQGHSPINEKQIKERLATYLPTIPREEMRSVLMIVFKWILYPIYQNANTINFVNMTYEPRSFIFNVPPQQPNNEQYEAELIPIFSVLIQTLSFQVYTIEGVSPDNTIADLKLKFSIMEPIYHPEHSELVLNEFREDGSLYNNRTLASYGITDGTVLFIVNNDPEITMYKNMIDYVFESIRIRSVPALEQLQEAWFKSQGDWVEEGTEYEKLQDQSDIIRILSRVLHSQN